MDGVNLAVNFDGINPDRFLNDLTRPFACSMLTKVMYDIMK